VKSAFFQLTDHYNPFLFENMFNGTTLKIMDDKYTTLRIIRTIPILSSHTIISSVIEILKQRLQQHNMNKIPKGLMKAHFLSESDLISFLEKYCATGEGEAYIETWTLLTSYFKTVISSASTHRILFPPILRYWYFKIWTFMETKICVVFISFSFRIFFS